jgi:hypothetical protein
MFSRITRRSVLRDFPRAGLPDRTGRFERRVLLCSDNMLEYLDNRSDKRILFGRFPDAVSNER